MMIYLSGRLQAVESIKCSKYRVLISIQYADSIVTFLTVERNIHCLFRKCLICGSIINAEKAPLIQAIT